MLAFKLNIAAYLCLKHMVWKPMTCHVNKFDSPHTRIKQKYKKKTLETFAGPSKNSDEKDKE